jgi:phosphate transport system protein
MGQGPLQEPTEAPRHLRRLYYERLEEINAKVTQLFALVGEGLAAATEALLSGDLDVARVLTERDVDIDAIYQEVEELVNQELALQAPVSKDLRFLLSVIRVVPELERSHDLAEHIARRAGEGFSEGLTPAAQGIVQQMGAIGVEMWRDAADAWFSRDAAAHGLLLVRDDEMDLLHAALTAELASGQVSVPAAMDMALVARFYERLGDHAVNVANRVRYMAGD